MGIDYVKTGPVATFTLRNGKVNPLTGLFRMHRLALGRPDVRDPFLDK